MSRIQIHLMAWAVVAAAIGFMAIGGGDGAVALVFLLIALAIWLGGRRFAR